MTDQPIIARISEQKCIGYGSNSKGSYWIIRNIGVDTFGQLWEWESHNFTSEPGNAHAEDVPWSYRRTSIRAILNQEATDG